MWAAEKRSIELLRFRSVKHASTTDATSTSATAALGESAGPTAAAAALGQPSDSAAALTGNAGSPERNTSSKRRRDPDHTSDPGTSDRRPKIKIKLEPNGPEAASRAILGFTRALPSNWSSFGPRPPAPVAVAGPPSDDGDKHMDDVEAAAEVQSSQQPPSHLPDGDEDLELAKMLGESRMTVDPRNEGPTVPGSDRDAASPTSMI